MREESGLTIADVASRVGVSKATIVYFEKDTRELSDATTRKLFGVLLKAQDQRRKRIQQFCEAMQQSWDKISGTSVSVEIIKDALIGSGTAAL